MSSDSCDVLGFNRGPPPHFSYLKKIMGAQQQLELLTKADLNLGSLRSDESSKRYEARQDGQSQSLLIDDSGI